MSPRLKIFVVDDEPTICSTLAAILRQSGYDATAYTNPIEALWAAERLQPHLVISDVAMPELNGIALAIRIQSKSPGCKVLLFSGHAATSDQLSEAKRRGYEFDLLAKPVHPDELLLEIKSIVEQSSSSRSLILIPDRPKLEMPKG